MIYLTQVTPETILGDLPLQDFQVSPTIPGQVIANQFEQQPELPGVIIADEQRLLGMISRRRFYEQMMHLYTREVFLQRPIQKLLEVSEQKVEYLVLPHTEKIEPAVQRSVTRPWENIPEPLIIEFKDEKENKIQGYLLLDFQTLILAQSQILNLFNRELKQQTLKSQHYLFNLKQEQQKVRQYSQLLEHQKSVLQERNQTLEKQLFELKNKLKAIAHSNQATIRISQLISLEGKKAFQATSTGVNTICSSINQVVHIGSLLSEELETLDSTSKAIERVSQQVRHLAVQAAIVANRAGKELSDFSQITTEIGKLVSQTSEAGRQVNQVSHRFLQKIQELVSSAQVGTTMARSLVQQNVQSEAALAELEAQLQQNYPDSSVKAQPLPEPVSLPEVESITPPERTQTLMQKIAQIETTLSELESRTKQKDSEPLIQKLKRTLEHHKKNLVQ